MKIWFFEILCYGKHRIPFWRRSPCESTGHCLSENVCAPDDGGKSCLRCPPRPVVSGDGRLGYVLKRGPL